MTDTVRARAPWHLWAVGLLAMAWNAFGAMDYTMTKLRGEAWLRQMQMTDAQIAYTLAMPAWMSAAWAIGVWGGVLGGLLLLLRSRLAVPVFAASLAAFVASLVYTYGLSEGAAIVGGPGIMATQGAILAGCLFFLWYARRAAALGRLG